MVVAPETDELLLDLQRLVEVESPSSDLSALARSAAAVAELIERRTGRAAELVEGPGGPHVRWSGGGEPKVLLLGHHDTVFPLGTLERRPFTVDGDRVTGPGVFDMKAGIVQAVHAVAGLADVAGVEMLWTCDEEIGSRTSRALLEERAAVCEAVIVCEPSADGGAVKTGRKGNGTIELVVGGRAAHAGLEPERGANALVEAARQVLDVVEIARPEIGTTVTPTIAHAGTADNVVPAEAIVRIDVRVLDPAEIDRVHAAVDAIRSHDPSCSVDVRGRIGRPPMPPSAAATLLAVLHEIDPTLAGVTVGGASDGNFTAALGVPTIDGLGAVGGGAHADHEHVIVSTLQPRTELLTALLARLLAR
jgi:glutamate carboxypeptidase